MKAVFLHRDVVINEIVYNEQFGVSDTPLSIDVYKREYQR